MKLYSSMRTLPVKRVSNARGQQREITLQLGLQSTAAYFPYIVYVFFCFFYYYVRSSVQFKIHAELRSLLVFLSFFLKLFLKISQMLVVCICYCYHFHIFLSFASEGRVARNTILLQRDSCGLARFNDDPGWCSDERGRLLRGY